MNLLLDTHVVLWLADDYDKLSEKAKQALTNEDNVRYVSIVSAWEVAIKLGSGKLRLDGGLSEYLYEVDRNNFYELGATRRYLSFLPELDAIHKDPFDRLLIATALAENFTIVTADENIRKYKVNSLW